MKTKTRRQGRPPLAWLSAAELHELPAGTAVTIETYGRHDRRTTGRIVAADTDGSIHLSSPLEGDVHLGPLDVKRGRTIESVYEPGDAVVMRGVDHQSWRGGVVRTKGTDVLVEQIDGSFVWKAEADLEDSATRIPKPPPSRRGPVPAPKDPAPK